MRHSLSKTTSYAGHRMPKKTMDRSLVHLVEREGQTKIIKVIVSFCCFFKYNSVQKLQIIN